MNFLINIFSRLSSIVNRHLAIASCLLVILAACSENSTDIPDPTPSQPQDETCGLTLSIPDFAFGSTLGTRADKEKDHIEAGEGGLQSLFLVIFKRDEDKFKAEKIEVYNNFFCADIRSTATINGTITAEYNQYKYYNIRLAEGNYKIYLLGNIEEYWVNPNEEVYQATEIGNGVIDSPFVTYLKGGKKIGDQIVSGEENIKNISLRFDGLIPSGHLPMICLPEEISEKKDGTNKLNQGVFEVTNSDVTSKNNKTLYAPLTFLCSKVRLTVLFDNTTSSSFSSAFPEADIQFTEEYQLDESGNILYLTTNYRGIRVDNVRKESKMLTDSSIEIDGTMHSDGFFTPISKTQYPSSETSEDSNKYFKITNLTKDESSPDYLTRLDAVQSWEPATRRAWQSNAIYLPENPVSDNNTATTLHVVPSGTNVPVKGYYIPLTNLGPNNKTLERDYFYDIVARMTTKEDFAIGVNIKVNAWKFHDISASW